MLFFSVVRDPGLNYSPPETKENDYILIEFHCLLLALQWGFNDASDVYIRFGAPVLGNFKYCYGPMQRINRFADCCVYMQCCVILQLNFRQHCQMTHNLMYFKCI